MVTVGVSGQGQRAWSVSFDKGERIWTESSYKYEPAAIEALGRRADFTVAAQWTDEDARFALTLFAAV